MVFKNNLIKGTFILTLSGVLSRFIGFFYRIFLSRTIGAEGVGLYQLVFPLYMLAFSISVSGIQTAISRLVSSHSAQSDKAGASQIVYTGLVFSLAFSVILWALFYYFSQPLSVYYLKNENAASLLRMLSFAIPFGSFHACVDGYYFGIQKPSIPAIRQLLEQGIRFLLLFFILSLNHSFSPITAIFILVAEEAFAALFSLIMLLFHTRSFVFLQKISFRKDSSDLLSIAFPLSANRLLVCLLQSMEAGLLPVSLQLSGYSSAQSLRIYGILSGMALPMILFPTAATSSLSTMLLPSVAAAQSRHSHMQVQKLICKSILICLGTGIAFSVFFLFLGKPVTCLLFQNTLAGSYVQTFSFICPILYLNPVLFSVLNGLGKSSSVFFYNLSGLLLRLLFVLLIVPWLGISGYFSGLFCSQILSCILCLHCIKKSSPCTS